MLLREGGGAFRIVDLSHQETQTRELNFRKKGQQISALPRTHRPLQRQGCTGGQRQNSEHRMVQDGIDVKLVTKVSLLLESSVHCLWSIFKYCCRAAPKQEMYNKLSEKNHPSNFSKKAQWQLLCTHMLPWGWSLSFTDAPNYHKI